MIWEYRQAAASQMKGAYDIRHYAWNHVSCIQQQTGSADNEISEFWRIQTTSIKTTSRYPLPSRRKSKKKQKSRHHYHKSQDDITTLNGCNSISSYKRPILAAIVQTGTRQNQPHIPCWIKHLPRTNHTEKIVGAGQYSYVRCRSLHGYIQNVEASASNHFAQPRKVNKKKNWNCTEQYQAQKD